MAAPIDPSVSSFSSKETVKVKVDTFDFAGEYPDLKKIEIDAKHKMRVEMLLTGIYPALRTVQYDGTFGDLNGKFTGAFPLLEKVGILCGSTTMHLDFTGQWYKSCDILITAAIADLTIKLPKDVGVHVDTKTTIKSKVLLKNSELKKLGGGWLNKSYVNEAGRTHPISLNFTVHLQEGSITFLSE